jgi:UDP-N-acetylglucosamine 2-epimerase
MQWNSYAYKPDDGLDRKGIEIMILILRSGLWSITFREETEWVETVAEGWNILVGTDHAKIMDGVKNWLPDKEKLTIYRRDQATNKIAHIFNTGGLALRERN